MFLTSCRNGNREEDRNVLARVYDSYLYASELQNLVPKGTPVKDSLIMAKIYINNWVRDKLLVYQAEKNLTDEQKNFEKQLQDYRNSLIVYQYKSLLINQKLDTNLSDEEIESYYDKFADNFKLKENITRLNYIKCYTDTVNMKLFRELIRSDNPNDKARLDSVCEMSATDFFLNDNYWVSFNELIAKIPINTMNQENYLRNHQYAEIQEEPFIYIVRFLDYKLKGDQSPLHYEKNNIIQIILNKRKTGLIKNMEEEIFNKALNKNEIEIF